MLIDSLNIPRSVPHLQTPLVEFFDPTFLYSSTDTRNKVMQRYGVTKVWGQALDNWRAQLRVAQSNGWKTRHGRSQSHVAWMAEGDGNVSF